MVPLGDDNPTQRTPLITLGLIVVNVVVFFHEITLDQFQLQQFFQIYAVVPRELTASFNGITINPSIPEWITLMNYSNPLC